MDIPRPGVARNKKIKRVIYVFLFLGGASAATYGLSKMKPAAPTVETATLWFGTVKRGPMLRDVHGTGTLVPEESRVIPAARDGLVEEIKVRIGDTVRADTILLVLSNADMEQTLIDAELQIRGAEADLTNLRAQLESQLINQKSSLKTTEVAAQRAKLQADSNEELAKDGLISDRDLKLSRLDAQNYAAQAELEKERVQVNAQSADAQIVASETRLKQLRTAYDVKKSQIDQLKVRAQTAGVLQQLPVQAGQRVSMGTVLAKVAEPGRLKAQLKIAETQAKDILLGQFSSIDTRNGIIPGRVIRIDPAATEGTVTVDVQLEGELPKGARPDLSVDGTVEIERLADVMFMERPTYGQADSTISIFKAMPNNEAIRTQVRLGRVSVNAVEILEGLQIGDRVILSDMSMWESVDRVRLN
jgi:HlyD family secretion protein